MRIISSFYDYYDKGIAYGIDPKLVYVRDQKEFDFNNQKAKKDLFKLALDMPSFPYGDFGVIGFCGKAYPFYQFYFNSEFKKTYYSVKDIEKDLENINGFRSFLMSKNSDGISDKVYRHVVEGYIDRLKSFVNTPQYFGGIFPSRYPNEFDIHSGQRIRDDIFIEYKSPVILAQRIGENNIHVTINPILNMYSFVVIHDPIMAFQEIAMYLGSNMANQTDPVTNFSDELKADIHGFDKWSFRKPGKKGMK
jgi:hypothetical protein